MVIGFAIDTGHYVGDDILNVQLSTDGPDTWKLPMSKVITVCPGSGRLVTFSQRKGSRLEYVVLALSGHGRLKLSLNNNGTILRYIEFNGHPGDYNDLGVFRIWDDNGQIEASRQAGDAEGASLRLGAHIFTSPEMDEVDPPPVERSFCLWG